MVPKPAFLRRTGQDLKSTKKAHLLRSIGLELFALLGFGKSAERPKPALTISLKVSLSRAAVHVLPTLTSIAIITVNLRTIYLGRTFTGLILSIPISSAMLQVASKAQELLIVASLTSIVMDAIRNELLGNGVPLGTIGGAFLFSSLSYFWSPDLWGSFRAQAPLYKKVCLYSLLVVSGLLAALAGPSTAVLIIPRDQSWNAGGANMYFRGRFDELWPTNFSNMTLSEESFCEFPNATRYAVCPSGGYPAMLDFAQTRFPIHNPGILYPGNSTTSLQLASQTLTLPSDFHLAPSISLKGFNRCLACETAVVGSRLAQDMIMSQLLVDWFQQVMSIPYNALTSSISEYKYYDYRSLEIDAPSRIPLARVACSPAQNISNKETSIQFPIMPQYGCWDRLNESSYLELNQTPTSDIRSSWVQLEPSFGVVSTGLVVEGPWDISTKTRPVLGCSIDARWTDGIISGLFSDINNQQFFGVINQMAGMDAGGMDAPLSWATFEPDDDPSMKHIAVDQQWLDLFTPQVVDPSNPSRMGTTLDMILSSSAIFDDLLNEKSMTMVELWNAVTLYGPNRTVSLEWILANMVTDGLSRLGSVNVLNTTGPVSSWSLLDYNKTSSFQSQLLGAGNPLAAPFISPYVTEKATITIAGLSYQAVQVTDYLSICVLLIHILLAFGHTLFLALTRRSSSCWDSLPELFTLLQNSRPAPMALKNTSAGIKSINTYGKVALIRATSNRDIDTNANASSDEMPRAEMIFKEEEPRGVELQRLLSTNAEGHSSSIKRQRTSIRSLSPFVANQSESTTVHIEVIKADALYS